MGNFMQNMMNAVARDQSTLSWQQMTDSATTQMFAKREGELYDQYNRILSDDAKQVADAKSTNDVSKKQTKYQKDATIAQANESQEDGNVQSAQQQASTDGSNLADKAQLAQSLNTIMSTLSNLLGRLL